MSILTGEDQRLIVLGLDGFEHTVAEDLISRGLMPQLQRLKSESARYDLDHGKHRLTGLAWEHFSVGKTPDRMRRWAAVSFDPDSYNVSQLPTDHAPFLSYLDREAVIFDAPYFDFRASENLNGLVGWGAHDPGIANTSRPISLFREIESKFGTYPAQEHIYSFCWPSPARTRVAGNALERALRKRTEIFLWLLEERFQTWDLGLVVIGELHSLIEPMWHGVDDQHPLHQHPSAAVARECIEAVYRALDDMIGELCEKFPQAELVAFSMHGMGPNNADIASMLLLPEFCHRRAFGTPFYQPRQAWLQSSYNAEKLPELGENEIWEQAVNDCLQLPSVSRDCPEPDIGVQKPFKNSLRNKMAALFSNTIRSKSATESALTSSQVVAPERSASTNELDWMPAANYRHLFHNMDCFALPAYYNGRIRINLEGREHEGRISIGQYQAFCDGLEADLRACLDPVTQEPVVQSIERVCSKDPMQLHATQGDLEIEWKTCNTLAFEHPGLGLIGPAPVRRTGGHTGGAGVLYIKSQHLPSGDYGETSSFDVAPTIVQLLGLVPPEDMSGCGLLPT
jgi:predicted AlkP superfamily phosphohydrolase/phosphomutase